ncbi:hypothetical protein [Desulforhabdus sp. TSK]|uniref:hypothetical protein n=1 Tax=Desulforhabdus sp. TSK TaxID=2925014 RepID=UPI001FC7E566|nr:hypothetical protein [Desulforhabdus sp. TSK]GKT09100.1 hypothetical protein DSTSK_24050 [Desulforhabdus sp. TSK]
MKVTEITVLVSKKMSKDFNSWTVSHGVTAEMELGEDWKQAARALRRDLKKLVCGGLNGEDKVLVHIK